MTAESQKGLKLTDSKLIYTIEFQPLGLRGQCQSSESLLACARKSGIGVTSVCGGQGKCHSCKVQVSKGSVTEPASSELEAFSTYELTRGWRLACQTYLDSDCKLNIPPDSMTTARRIQVEGLEMPVALETPIRAYDIALRKPSLIMPKADDQRLLEALSRKHGVRCRIDVGVLRSVSSGLRTAGGRCRALVRNNEVVALGPGKMRPLGLAIDLGTTKIAGYLLDLSDGRTLACKGIINPQINYGEDIISRLNVAARSSGEATQMQMLVVEALNQLACDLCVEIGGTTQNIVEAVVVGNTAMHHLLLGLPVKQLAVSPYIPAVSRAQDIKARDIGLHISQGAYVHLLPNIAGFVGGDHVAVLLATETWQAEQPVIVIDIGTNTEVSLIANSEITTVSCASGPAFEGYAIKHGMRAASGAIERVYITGNRVRYQTIDSVPPIGICGSGLIDALAQLYLGGVIDKSGKMTDRDPRVRSNQKHREFKLVRAHKSEGRPALVITQRDIRELQLAKAAIRTGIQVLLEKSRCSEEELNHMIIAGAFGSYINVSSAMTIGMLPALPLERVRQVGNAAGMGAKLALLSLTKRDQAQALASRARYIELAAVPHFARIFVQTSYLGRYRIEKGGNKEID